MPITAAHQMLDYIRTRLDRYAEQVSRQCALGFNDEAKKAETFYQHLFNCLGYQFENMNSLGDNPLLDLPEDLPPGSLNYPAIDLGDSKARIAVQISFQRRNQTQKLDRTYAKFLKHDLHKQYDVLWLLFPTASANSAPYCDPIDYPEVDISVATHENLVEILERKTPRRIRDTYDFVRYWLDGTFPDGTTINRREEHAIAVRFDQLLSAIPPPYGRGSNALREKAQRVLEVRYCKAVSAFVAARTRASKNTGGAYAHYPLLPEFRMLEQRIDSLTQELDVKFFGGRGATMPAWQQLSYPHREFMGFKPGSYLTRAEIDYCEQIGRQTYLLAQLISEHRELVNAPPSVPGFTHF